jgi:hypothetical protein
MWAAPVVSRDPTNYVREAVMRYIAACLAACAILAATTSTALAGHFRITEQNFRTDFRPLTFNAAGRNISCNITVTGRFESTTIAKETLRGQASITAVNPVTAGAPPCTGGTITILTETLPGKSATPASPAHYPTYPDFDCG